MFAAVIATMATLPSMRPAAMIGAAFLGLGVAAARVFSSPR